MPFIGNQPADKFLTLEKQVFTTSATDTYVLDREVSSVNDIELFLNNVRQEPTEAYTISGTTLTLASAITASDSMYCIYQGRAVGTQSPAVGSVTNDMLAGSIANAKLANSSVTVNGTSIDLGASGTISAGITEADQWRITVSTVHGENFLTGNWERNDTSFSLIGTGMTQSSGVFTFPSTGLYKVDWSLNFSVPANTNVTGDYTGGYISATTNNSSYSKLAEGYNAVHPRTSIRYTSAHMSAIFDVTDTSTHKVKFASNVPNPDIITQGSSSVNYTYATFIRLGDT